MFQTPRASSFAAGAFSAPDRSLDAGGFVSGWCSGHKLAALPSLVCPTTKSHLPSHLRWLSQLFPLIRIRIRNYASKPTRADTINTASRNV